jgi:hypothetical protein
MKKIIKMNTKMVERCSCEVPLSFSCKLMTKKVQTNSPFANAVMLQIMCDLTGRVVVFLAEMFQEFTSFLIS